MPRYFVVVDTFAARATPMSLITRLVSFLQPRYERHPVAMPAVLLALWLCLAVGWRSLGMPDEGRYSVIALDMALHNQWLEPLLNGLPFFHKPPLFYWINGLALKLFGTSCWAAAWTPASESSTTTQRAGSACRTSGLTPEAAAARAATASLARSM